MDEDPRLTAIRRWDKDAMYRMIRSNSLTPDIRLSDPRKKREMPPIGHIIEYMVYGAHEPLRAMYAMHKDTWDPWVPYVIERFDGSRIKINALSHLIECHVERREIETPLYDALRFFEQTENANTGFNMPFVFEEWDANNVPIHSKWSALAGQSLCAVILQQMERPMGFLYHVLDAGGRFHVGDPPGLFVLATFRDYFRDHLAYRVLIDTMRDRLGALMADLKNYKDQIPSEVICAIEPRTQRNLFHWMAAISPWPSLGQSLEWLDVLHKFGFSVFTRDGDGRTAMELAANNPYVKNNCLTIALREMEKKERELYAMFATKHQVMHGLGLPREVSERVQPYPKTWRKREEDTADWFYNRRPPHVSAHTSWDFMSKWHPFNE
jgi:hypothetical protein